MENLPKPVNQTAESAKLDINSVASEILKDPSKFSSFVNDTANLLKEAQDKALELKERNFFKRVFSSSSKDFAGIILSQHNILQNFFVLLQTITFVSGRNTALLLSLSDSLRKGINLNDEEQRNLYAFADSYLQDAIDSANNERIREEALKKVLILTSDIIQSNELTSNKVDQLVDSEMIIRQRLAQTDNAVNSLRDSLNSQSEWFAKENAMHQNELDRLGASLTELSKEFVEANTSLQSIQVELMSQSERLTKENKILKYFIGASMCLSILAFALAFAFLQQ